MSDQQEIQVHIHCRNLPGTNFDGRTSLRLGLQKGKEVIEDVPADVESVSFTVPLRVATNPKSGQPNFLGPFAHGTPEDRFLYLCWGERKAEGWDGFRRAKIRLNHLGWECLRESVETAKPIEFTVDMTDEKGGPRCASVRV